MDSNLMINKCRICFKEKPNSCSLYDESIKYADRLNEYLGMRVETDNKYPSKICNKCEKQLLAIETFVQKLRNSTSVLEKAAELNIPFGEYLNKSVKVEEDDNIPLSVVSAGLKREPQDDDYLLEDTVLDDDMLTSLQEDNTVGDPREDEETRKIEFSNNYVDVVNDKNGYKRNMVQCLTCGLKLQNKSAFIVHNRRHTGEKPCKCKHCDKRFTQTGTLAEHIRRHHPNVEEKNKKFKRRKEQLYICQYCGRNFTKKNYLTVHVRIHTAEKPYKCSQCPKAFRRCIDFTLHRRIHSGDKPYSCHICTRSFISHTPLKRHLSVHSDERKFKCNICNAAVKSKDSLKKHKIVMHTADRPYVCNLCNASFALKYNLKGHMKSKHSERSGVCGVCKKEFSNLQKHMNTHSAERTYCCLLCNRKFYTEKGLATHTSKHNTENSSFTCTYEGCTVAFPKQSRLDFHILKYHTNYLSHVCECCSKSFCRLPDLRRHIKSVHPPSTSELQTLPSVVDTFTC